MTHARVLMVELNEITWDLIDPLIEQGKLPTFARLKREAAWAAPMSVDLPPQMDPWITWTTVYTGRPQQDHNVFFLQQPPDTIKAPRIWEICHEQGLSVGVYGSLCSWPPQCVKGFYVPDTFAPDSATYPEALRPIQDLNLTYTRSVRLPVDEGCLRAKLRLVSRLVALGLSAKTAARIVHQLTRERWNPEVRWQRVALQPLVNYDFFRRLYYKHQPAFASFHSNHVAHYMHTYWKAMQPDAFPQATSPDEMRVFGGAIEYGYRIADELLEGMLKLIDRETVLVVASSLGQKPYVSALKKGKIIGQVRSLDGLLEILGVVGRARSLATMSDQFNIYADSPETSKLIVEALRSAYIDVPGRPMFCVETLGHDITVTLNPDDEISEQSRGYFPHRGEGNSYRYLDLVHRTGTIKSGCHDPKGMLFLYGSGIPRGAYLGECNNLDIAPTLLTLLGISVPREMKGRVLLDGSSGCSPQQSGGEPAIRGAA
jgi:hypothetical protein